jgi:lipoyl(octanoyl) transferase
MEIKISKKPVKYEEAIEYLHKRVHQVSQNKNKELIWFLEHKSVYTCGVNFNQKDVLDKNVKIVKTNRGGKITWHGRGQLICYFVLDISKRERDIRKFITAIENSIIETLKSFKISSFSDRKNIGIWVLDRNEEKKIAAIGFRIKKWIAFHGFSLNLSNNLNNYKKIVPCGISDKGISKVENFKNISKNRIIDKLKTNLIKNLKY